MIGSIPQRAPDYHDKNPDILAAEQKLCVIVLLLAGAIVTILYFTLDFPLGK